MPATPTPCSLTCQHRGDVWRWLCAILTTSTVPAIKINSFVRISTISRTFKEEDADKERDVDPTASLPIQTMTPLLRETSSVPCDVSCTGSRGRQLQGWPSPVWGRRWRARTGGPCPHSCGGTRLHCTSSGACREQGQRDTWKAVSQSKSTFSWAL